MVGDIQSCKFDPARKQKYNNEEFSKSRYELRIVRCTEPAVGNKHVSTEDIQTTVADY